ncbi:ImmA/IrrE family metallo-endopeptidase [Trueperella sp. LYQ141]|uniref:ImmA/IrrE family metallo-endopeptidase n=1 Tax=Trueperella sp. LYQ141 TaxID=3391058 RepID=UPI0039834282
MSMTINDLISTIHALHLHLVLTHPQPGQPAGYYDHTTHTIYLAHTPQSTALRCTLAHELAHAYRCDHGHQTPSVEHLCDQTAARMLIDENDYATAEHLYAGNPWAIADELGVTTRLLIAYQTWLTQNPPHTPLSDTSY